jgi:putative Mg2+ transporter-C (MgtC) family protein
MISPWELVLRLAVAAILDALVGLERERLEWAAGMRTHALVSLGSALFMVVSIFGFSDILSERHVILDPSRVAAQVASGIGFIGAGTIIFRREVVKGLTTAASIWAVAAVGLAVGGGMFLAAVSATLLALALLVHHPNAIGELRTTVVIPFVSTAKPYRIRRRRRKAT